MTDKSAMSAVCEVCNRPRSGEFTGDIYAICLADGSGLVGPWEGLCWQRGYGLQRTRAEKAERERDEAQKQISGIKHTLEHLGDTLRVVLNTIQIRGGGQVPHYSISLGCTRPLSAANDRILETLASLEKNPWLAAVGDM